MAANVQLNQQEVTMKKTILIILTTVLGTLFLFTGVSFGQYGYEDDADVYDNYEYSDYEYRLDNPADQLDRYRGPVYYFHHQRANVYFVLVGDMTFVVPGYTFRSYLARRNFVLVPQTRFITLSCGGLDHYDSSLRFNFYVDFYNRHRWGQGYHTQLRRDFSKYYTGRHYNHGYQKDKRYITEQRVQTRYQTQHRSPVNDRRQIKGQKTYKQKGDSHQYRSKRKFE